MAVAANALTTLAKAKAALGDIPDADDTFVEACIDRASDMIERYCERPLKEATFTDKMFDGSGGNAQSLDAWPVSAVARVTVGLTPGLTLRCTSTDANSATAFLDKDNTQLSLVIVGGDDAATPTLSTGTYTTLASLQAAADDLSGWTVTNPSARNLQVSTDLFKTGTLNALGENVELMVPETDLSDYQVDWDSGCLLRRGGFPRGRENILVTFTAGYSTIPVALEMEALSLVDWLFKKRNEAGNMPSIMPNAAMRSLMQWRRVTI